MEGFRQEISEHMLGLTVPKSDIVSIKSVRNEEITNIDMAGPLAGGCAAVVFKAHGALVVLLEITLPVRETLGL